jgi:hypothetical protein
LSGIHQEVKIMAAHPGEQARAFHCQRCHNTVRVNKRASSPNCSDCGNNNYGERTQQTSGG